MALETAMSLNGTPANMDHASRQDYNQKIQDMRELEYPMLRGRYSSFNAIDKY